MTNEPVPCKADLAFRKQVEVFSETLKTEAHKLGNHGLSEAEFYHSGLLRASVESIRGQYSASMHEKREFVKLILNYMQDQNAIQEWSSAGSANRYDYEVTLNDGRRAGIELKGCLDGNNTNIFERPPHVQEFIIWSVCSNPGADPRHNVWSGIHSRLSAEIISRQQRVDGLVVLDWVCGTIGRPCPKLNSVNTTKTTLGQYQVPSPCIYLFPNTVPSPRNNPKPTPQNIKQVGILAAFHSCFKGCDNDLNYVEFEVAHVGSETTRTTTIYRDGQIVRQSKPTPIQRS